MDVQVFPRTENTHRQIREFIGLEEDEASWREYEDFWCALTDDEKAFYKRVQMD